MAQSKRIDAYTRARQALAIRAALEDLLEFVEDNFQWALAPKFDEGCTLKSQDGICDECRKTGCLRLKIDAARKALR